MRIAPVRLCSAVTPGGLKTNIHQQHLRAMSNLLLYPGVDWQHPILCFGAVWGTCATSSRESTTPLVLPTGSLRKTMHLTTGVLHSLLTWAVTLLSSPSTIYIALSLVAAVVLLVLSGKDPCKVGKLTLKMTERSSDGSLGQHWLSTL